MGEDRSREFIFTAYSYGTRLAPALGHEKITGTALGLTLVASLLTLHCARPEGDSKPRLGTSHMGLKSKRTGSGPKEAGPQTEQEPGPGQPAESYVQVQCPEPPESAEIEAAKRGTDACLDTAWKERADDLPITVNYPAANPPNVFVLHSQTRIQHQATVEARYARAVNDCWRALENPTGTATVSRRPATWARPSATKTAHGESP